MKTIAKLAFGLLVFAILYIALAPFAKAADFEIVIPEGTTDADFVVIEPFARPVRIVADRVLFADGFE